MKKAISAVEHAVQSSPWSLTENYVSAVLEKKVAGSLALVGAGDPSGRGRGYSFTKDPRRVHISLPWILPACILESGERKKSFVHTFCDSISYQMHVSTSNPFNSRLKIGKEGQWSMVKCKYNVLQESRTLQLCPQQCTEDTE